MPDTVTVPSLDEGEKLLARFAKLSAAVAGHEAALAAKIAPLKKAADAKIVRITDELGDLREQLEPWWKAHGEAFTKGKKKSHELAGCVIGTRANPKRLVFAGVDEAAAIAALVASKFRSLVKRVPQLDKKAILERVEKDPDGDVAKLGFSVLRGETFFVDLATRTIKA